jgi:hypothetical protein
MSADEVTDPSKFFNILIIATSIYVIVMLIIIYYSLIAPIKTTPDKFSDEYIKQQQQTSIENYFKEKNKEPKSGNRFYNYAKNYSMKFTNYFKTTINWFYDNRNFFIVLFTGFGFSTLTLTWINYYESTTIKELKKTGSDITQKKLTDKLKELKTSFNTKKTDQDNGENGRIKKKEKIMKDIENKYNGKNTQDDFDKRIGLERKINDDINEYNRNANKFNSDEEKNIS